MLFFGRLSVQGNRSDAGGSHDGHQVTLWSWGHAEAGLYGEARGGLRMTYVEMDCG